MKTNCLINDSYHSYQIHLFCQYALATCKLATVASIRYRYRVDQENKFDLIKFELHGYSDTLSFLRFDVFHPHRLNSHLLVESYYIILPNYKVCELRDFIRIETRTSVTMWLLCAYIFMYGHHLFPLRSYGEKLRTHKSRKKIINKKVNSIEKSVMAVRRTFPHSFAWSKWWIVCYEIQSSGRRRPLPFQEVGCRVFKNVFLNSLKFHNSPKLILFSSHRMRAEKYEIASTTLNERIFEKVM